MRSMLLAVLFACLAGPAAAQSAPVERAGEWITTMTMVGAGGGGPGGQPVTMKICRAHDRVLDAKTMGDLIARHHGSCSQQEGSMDSSGGSFVFTCEMHGMTVHAHGEVKRLGDGGFSTHVVSQMQDSRHGTARDMEMTMTARYGGPCQPGDMQVPD